MNDSPTKHAVRETAQCEIKRMAVQYPGVRTWVVVDNQGQRHPSALATEYLQAITRAAGDDIEAVHDGVEAAILATAGSFPPTPSDVARHVRTLRLQRQRERDAAERIRSRREDPHPRAEWLGWLAFGAHHAHLRDTGQAEPPIPGVAPYLALCEEIGYRNRHGCSDDPEHDPALAVEAQARAEALWRYAGEPASPPVSALVGGAA